MCPERSSTVTGSPRRGSRTFTGSTAGSLAVGAATPSRLLLRVLGDVAVPPGLPPFASLRGQPCRPYRPVANTVR